MSMLWSSEVCCDDAAALQLAMKKVVALIFRYVWIFVVPMLLALQTFSRICA